MKKINKLDWNIWTWRLNIFVWLSYLWCSHNDLITIPGIWELSNTIHCYCGYIILTTENGMQHTVWCIWTWSSFIPYVAYLMRVRIFRIGNTGFQAALEDLASNFILFHSQTWPVVTRAESRQKFFTAHQNRWMRTKAKIDVFIQ